MMDTEERAEPTPQPRQYWDSRRLSFPRTSETLFPDGVGVLMGEVLGFRVKIRAIFWLKWSSARSAVSNEDLPFPNKIQLKNLQALIGTNFLISREKERD